MARMSRSRRRSSSGRTSRRKDWGAATIVANGIAPNLTASSYIFAPTNVRGDYVDPTILALRTKFSARLVSTPTGGGAVALGIIRWNDVDDVPDGAPGPITNPNLDWMQRIVFPVPSSTPASTIFTTELDQEYLSKARRKMGNDTGLLAVLESYNFTGSNVDFAFDTRFLLME